MFANCLNADKTTTADESERCHRDDDNDDDEETTNEVAASSSSMNTSVLCLVGDRRRVMSARDRKKCLRKPSTIEDLVFSINSELNGTFDAGGSDDDDDDDEENHESEVDEVAVSDRSVSISDGMLPRF